MWRIACDTILVVYDAVTIDGQIRPFRDAKYYEEQVFFSNGRDRGRRLLAIAIPFIQGDHYFESGEQVLSIVECLSEARCVHGDIRA